VALAILEKGHEGDLENSKSLKGLAGTILFRKIMDQFRRMARTRRQIDPGVDPDAVIMDVEPETIEQMEAMEAMPETRRRHKEVLRGLEREKGGGVKGVERYGGKRAYARAPGQKQSTVNYRMQKIREQILRARKALKLWVLGWISRRIVPVGVATAVVVLLIS